MPTPSLSRRARRPAGAARVPAPALSAAPCALPHSERAAFAALFDDDTSPVDWSEEEVVFLHWRLLQDVNRLADPSAPLEDKFETLRWVFTDPEKDARPFSFVNCLRVVGLSPLSPIAYCGRIDAEEVRDHLRGRIAGWLAATLERYPDWVREAVAGNPAWIEARLAKNPQWINEQVKRLAVQGDLFA